MRMEAEQLSTLVEQAKNQNSEAITKLYEEFHNGVYFLCLKIVKNEDDALDLVQDSFLQAFGKLDTLQNPAQFRSWLNQIAANKCRDYLKKKKPVLFSQQQSGGEEEEENEPEIEDRDESLIPDKALDTEETRRLIMEIIDGLPDLQRMTVMLYYYEEKSIAEIAAIMECSENTVKSRLNYARKQIKEGVLELEKKGTKLYGVMPMLFPIIHHAAADVTVPSGASSAVLGHITSSLAAGPAQGAAGTASVHGAASHIAAKTSATVRKAVAGFSKLSLPAKIGAGIAAAAVVTGVGLGVSAAVRRSVPVQAAPKAVVSSTISNIQSSSGEAASSNESTSSSVSYEASSSAPVSSGNSSSRTVSSKGSAGSSLPASSAKAASAAGNIPITSVKLSRDNRLPLYIGSESKLTASVSPSNAPQSVIWSSSDTSVATVDSSGNVKAIGRGNCTVTAKAVSDKNQSCSLGVMVEPEFTYEPSGDLNAVASSGNVVTIQYDKVDKGSTCNGYLRLGRNNMIGYIGQAPDGFQGVDCEGETTYKLSNSSVLSIKNNHGMFVVLGRGTVKVTMSCPESSNSLTVTVNVV